MAWLAGGVIYSILYVAVGWFFRGYPAVFPWFRIAALLVPPMTGVVVIARRRHTWSGCHWLFWATIAFGVTMSAIGLLGWTVDEVLLDRETSWLGWYTVFTLFGGVAPLFALLAQPHRGPREGLTATTAVDIAGIAVMTGFLYSHFVVSPDLTPITSERPSWALLALCQFQQLIVCVGMTAAALVARRQPWGQTYRRLAVGLFVNLVILAISTVEIRQGLYRAGFVYDLIWIMPFAFFPWAAAAAPASEEGRLQTDDAGEVSRPWIVFGALGVVPLLEYGLRQVMPLGALDGFRDLFMAITIASVLPLLMARLAVERDEARQAVRRRRLLAAATEQAGDLISIVTPDGRIEHANGAFCRAVGCPLEEVIDRPSADFLAEESHAQVATISEIVRKDGVWRGTLVRRRRDASTFPSASSVVALSSPHEHITHFVAVDRDITREAELRDQLIHSERLAAAGQLVSGVAHELNNPLQAIAGYADLMLSAERREEKRADLSQIRSQAGRAAKIVRNLLTFVRKTRAERISTDINEVVRAAVALRSYELGVHNIEIEEQYADPLPPVNANREEIQQVILNLVVNAEHAMQSARGSGRMWIRTSRADDAVYVEVQDDGPGIPAELTGRVFEPFFSTKEVGQGTGLGLSIALGIAQAHDGSLTVQPTPEGACFRLTLPATAEPERLSREASPRPQRLPQRAGGRALVADDELPLRQLLQRLLAQRGFSVDVAGDGLAAMALIEQKSYDVAFCDISMPKMGGLALYEELRALGSPLARAFVFTTGNVFSPELESVVASAQVPVLSKPFSGGEVDAALDQLFARGAIREPVGA